MAEEAASVDIVMRAPADSTRRAAFDRIVSFNEITVVELTRRGGVTQGAVSQHLRSLKQAGLVQSAPRGATSLPRPARGLGPLVGWMNRCRVFWRKRFADLGNPLKEIDP
jgi:DNA-binding transcriptional ArsR family regulator